MIYREFIIRSPESAKAAFALVKANAQAAIDSGSPLRIIITAEEKRRNNDQNRYLWGVVYKTISEQAYVNNRLFSSDVWHETLARKFWICEDVTLPDGEVIVRRKSTSLMSVGDFSLYIEQVRAYAATELGVVFE